MIIAFEGLWWSGKTTQIDILYKYLSDKWLKWIILKWWWTGWNTKELQNIKNKIDNGLDNNNELLFKTIKLQFTQFKKAIKSNYDFIILDRNIYTFYVSAKSRNKNLENIFPNEIISIFKNTPKLDFVIYLDIEPWIALNKNKNKVWKSFSDKNISLLKEHKKCEEYSKIANKEKWLNIKVTKNSKLKSKQDINNEIIEKLKM